MPNIHIHTDDAAITAAIVAYCMSIDLGRLRLTIDNSDRYDINGSLTNRVAGETGHRVVETVMRADMELAAERAIARQERQAVMESEYIHNRSVTCPYCQAEPTQPCAKPDGSYHPRPYVHSLRRGEANRVAVDGTHEERRSQRNAMRIDQRQDRLAARAAKNLGLVIAAAATESHEWASYCMCGHDRASHDNIDHGDAQCLVDACDCPSFTAVEPFSPVTLDEM